MWTCQSTQHCRNCSWSFKYVIRNHFSLSWCGSWDPIIIPSHLLNCAGSLLNPSPPRFLPLPVGYVVKPIQICSVTLRAVISLEHFLLPDLRYCLLSLGCYFVTYHEPIWFPSDAWPCHILKILLYFSAFLVTPPPLFVFCITQHIPSCIPSNKHSL